MTEKLIYPAHDIKILDHNVVGAGGVLWSIDPNTQEKVGGHYDPRAADQFLGNHNREAFVLTQSPEDHQSQLDYRGAIGKVDLTAIRDVREITNPNGHVALYVPYISREMPNFPTELNWKRYGLPYEITSLLKNKADFHDWLTQNDLEANTPNHVICEAKDITSSAEQMLLKIQSMYQEAKIDDQYPIGLMLRGAEGDGNYGAAKIVQSLHNQTILTKKGEVHVQAGQIMIMPDGKKDNLEVHDNWQTALLLAQLHIKDSMNLDQESRVVMSRLIDLQDSPGMSAIIAGGTPHLFNWNGQWQEPGESACTGTTSPGLNGNNRLHELFLEETQAIFSTILSKQLEGRANRDEIYAMINIDLMIPGALEQKLWQKTQSRPSLHQYRNNLGKNNHNYQPRPYNPNIPLIAEINPRDTNWTLAVKSVLTALKRQATVQNMLALANGQDTKIIARDAWTLPGGLTDMNLVRDEMLQLHHQLEKSGAGFILRMPGHPQAGAIGWTSEGHPSDVFNQARERLSQHAS